MTNRTHDIIIEIRFLIDELEKRVNDMETDVSIMNRLRGAGVDNWDGYSEAMRSDDNE